KATEFGTRYILSAEISVSVAVQCTHTVRLSCTGPSGHTANASATTQSSCMPPGAPVRTLPISVTEYSNASSSSMPSGQTSGRGSTSCLFSSNNASELINAAFDFCVNG